MDAATARRLGYRREANKRSEARNRSDFSNSSDTSNSSDIKKSMTPATAGTQAEKLMISVEIPKNL